MMSIEMIFLCLELDLRGLALMKRKRTSRMRLQFMLTVKKISIPLEDQ